MLPLSVQGSIPASRTACCLRSAGIGRRSFEEFREPVNNRLRSRPQVEFIPGSARPKAELRGTRLRGGRHIAPPLHHSEFFLTLRDPNPIPASGPISSGGATLTARGKSPHGIRPSLHRRGRRCDSGTYSRYARRKRLVRRAQDRSRCSRDFHHGLLRSGRSRLAGRSADRLTGDN